MWLSTSRRPDISNVVRAIAICYKAPKSFHCKAALGILEFINGTSEYGITHKKEILASILLGVFVDTDYTTETNDRRSASGGVIMC